MEFDGIYPLVKSHSYGKSPFLLGKLGKLTISTGPFSLNFRGVPKLEEMRKNILNISLTKQDLMASKINGYGFHCKQQVPSG